MRTRNGPPKERAGRPRGLPVVRWRSSGLRPSLATADSLPSSHGQSGRCRRPQVLRYARTCAALRSTAGVPVSSWAKKAAGRPKTRKRDRASRGQSTRRHDRRRVFAGLLVAPVFLLEGNSVTARLNFETPARLSLAALERLTLRAVYQAHNTTARLYNDSGCHHDTRKTHLTAPAQGIMPVNSEERAFLLKRLACLDQAATLSVWRGLPRNCAVSSTKRLASD